MDRGATEPGCQTTTLAIAAVVLLCGAVVFVPTSGTSFTALVPAWLAVVSASLLAAGVALAGAIDGIAPAGAASRGALTIGATVALTALGAWSLATAVGPGATGTLNEAIPLIVDPLVAAVLVGVCLVRPSRPAGLVFVVAAALTVAAILRFVAIVGLTYGA